MDNIKNNLLLRENERASIIFGSWKDENKSSEKYSDSTLLWG